MAYFALPYKILFHDTMAYGSHHHMTNIKFQNLARETLFFGAHVNGKDWREQFADIVILTREAYSLNLAPVGIGDKVGILLSYEEPSRSSVRFCFRTVNEAGQPVSCGYQNLVMIHKDTLQLVPAPGIVAHFLDTSKAWHLVEPNTSPNFKELVHQTTGLKKIFNNEMVALGQHIARLPDGNNHPRIWDTQYNTYSIDFSKTTTQHQAAKATPLPHPVVPATLLKDIKTDNAEMPCFLLQGQGGFNRSLVKNLYAEDNSFQELVKTTDAICLSRFGATFTDFLHTESPAESMRDFDQFGIYLTGLFFGKKLIAAEIAPQLLIGHSFGEITALALADAFSIEEGIHIIGHRIKALQQHAVPGKMMAFMASESEVASLLRKNNFRDLEVTVVNGDRQIVLSGNEERLASFGTLAATNGIKSKLLKSAYPFHSSLLSKAKEAFWTSLGAIDFKEPTIPVVSGTKLALYQKENIRQYLRDQLVETLDFKSIVELLGEKGYRHFIECGAGNMISGLVENNLPENSPVTLHTAATIPNQWKISLNALIRSLKPGNGADQTQKTGEQCVEEPIAIVGMGGVFPGAASPEAFWQNLLTGKSGIVNLGDEIDGYREDFIAGSVNGRIDIVPDKTYTLLSGTILEVPYEPALHGTYCDAEQFEHLTRGQKLLITALAQSLQDSGEDLSKTDHARIECILGSTADGVHEFDEAVVRDLMLEEFDQTDAAPAKAAAAEAFKHAFGDLPQHKELRQYTIYRKVLDDIIKLPVDTYVVDTACSSSLYSINFGIKSLLDGEKDLILAGGVFAPGPANNALFAQFRGLTPTESRPLDHKADGVIFGDGAGIVILKRLSDAIKDGNKIHGVIRAMGLSSDGKSPGINVPQQRGQQKAVERALEKYNISKNSIQYVETHATSTPVGDAVEVNSLSNVFGDRDPSLPKIGLRSPKALIGHTGWSAGVHSVMKVLLALKHKQVPGQPHYEAPNPGIDLDSSPFSISAGHEVWTENTNNLPRRAGINSFGFGGTNAHIIVEEYVPDYHKALTYPPGKKQQDAENVVVLDASFLYPHATDLAGEQPNGVAKFDRSKLKLPPKKLLLPDVTDHMDATQFLLSLAAGQLLTNHPDLKKYADRTGVVAGITGKTENGIKAGKRVLKDRVKRTVISPLSGIGQETKDKLFEQYLNDTITSGPYTLPGLMPNVSASRVPALFNLNGPNVVIDRGERSMLDSLYVGAKLVQHGDAQLVLAGGVYANAISDKTGKEGVCMLALASESVAKELGITQYKPLDPEGLRRVEVSADVHYSGIKGITALQEAWKKAGNEPLTFSIAGAVATNKAAETTSGNAGTHSDDTPKTHRFVKGTPIVNYLPTIVPSQPLPNVYSIKEKKLVFVCDDEKMWKTFQAHPVSKMMPHKIVVLPGHPASDTLLPMDVRDEHSIKSVCEEIAAFADTIIFLKDMEAMPPEQLIEDEEVAENFHFQAHFHLAQQLYDRLAAGTIHLFSVLLNACHHSNYHPYTGLVGGFIKSLQRELPDGVIRAIHMDNNDWMSMGHMLETESVQPNTEAESFYIDGKRHVLALRPTEHYTIDHKTYLDNHSVVIATGGGKGVTAVMAEELLRTFGCKVIAIGRTRLEGTPQEYLEIPEKEFAAFEKTFYKNAFAAGDKNIKALKANYQKYRSANELANVIRSLDALPGSFEYHAVDINNGEAVEAFVAQTVSKHGKVDMLMHGAGVQYSGMLKKKPYADFQKVVQTKVKSLSNFYNALQKHLPQDHVVHYHLLTSAFSYLGNDGQEDYGAANEYMNRLAEYFNAKGRGVWTSLAWLGWEGIGMTRGSEYAALAASRSLRGVSRSEGAHLFKELMAGTPAGASNIILAQGEVDFYHPVIIKKEARPEERKNGQVNPLSKEETVFHHHLSLESAPFLNHHLVRGIPTVPGAFTTTLICDGAQKRYPDLKVASLDEIQLKRLIKVYHDRPTNIRVHLNPISIHEDTVKLKVEVKSDFTHVSGIILEKDILHADAIITMEKAHKLLKNIALPKVEGIPFEDPFTMQNTYVALSGSFKSIRSATLNADRTLAHYAFKNPGDLNPKATYAHMLPGLTLLDASWRVATFKKPSNNAVGLYVPVKCEKMNFGYNFTHFDAPLLSDHFHILVEGAPVLTDDDMLHVGRIYVINSKHETLLEVEGGICKKIGEMALMNSENVL